MENKTARAKTGDKVMVNYLGTLDDGTIFDSSLEPLEFEIGQQTLLPLFEHAVIGMKQGETKTIRIAPQYAYGEYKDGCKFSVDRSEFPPDFNPQVGMTMQGRSDQGNTIEAVIKEVGDEKVIMDSNHPLAGKHLTFEITLIEILNTV
ncbi:MAG TPA: peptidylprolyl isomerase [Desulfobacteraceae bacterium]|nr:peptidylprolyl isomerase [Desulfobacteraceae bacterium]